MFSSLDGILSGYRPPQIRLFGLPAVAGGEMNARLKVAQLYIDWFNSQVNAWYKENLLRLKRWEAEEGMKLDYYKVRMQQYLAELDSYTRLQTEKIRSETEMQVAALQGMYGMEVAKIRGQYSVAAARQHASAQLAAAQLQYNLGKERLGLQEAELEAMTDALGSALSQQASYQDAIISAISGSGSATGSGAGGGGGGGGGG